MIPTKQMQQKIRDWLVKNDISNGDLYKVEGMGNLYISLDLEHANEHQHQYTLERDGTAYHFFAKLGGP